MGRKNADNKNGFQKIVQEGDPSEGTGRRRFIGKALEKSPGKKHPVSHFLRRGDLPERTGGSAERREPTLKDLRLKGGKGEGGGVGSPII